MDLQISASEIQSILFDYISEFYLPRNVNLIWSIIFVFFLSYAFVKKKKRITCKIYTIVYGI